MSSPTDTTNIEQDALIDQADNVIRLVNDSRCSLGKFSHRADERMDATQRELEEAEVASDLVSRIHAGDSAAENELVKRYEDRLRYVMYRQMAQFPHDVDDVVQNTFTTAIVKLRQQALDDPARLGGYLYGIAKNIRLTALRDHARHDGVAGSEQLEQMVDDVPGPEHITAGEETTRIMRRLLAELGSTVGRERDREVLVRLYLEQQDKNKICEDLGIDPEHLRRVLYRAKQRLKVLLMEARQQGLEIGTED